MRITWNVVVVFMVLAMSVGQANALNWTHPNQPSAAAMPDVMALLHFDENAGTSSANASTLSGDDVTLSSSAMWYAGGVFGSAINVNGTGEHVAWTDVDGDGLIGGVQNPDDAIIPVDWSKGMTVSFWTRVEPPSTPSVGTDDNKDAQAYYDISRGWTNLYNFLKTDQYGNMRYRANAGRWEGQVNQNLKPHVADGQWHHLAVVYDVNPSYIDHGTDGWFGDWILYVDNVKVYSHYEDTTIYVDINGNPTTTDQGLGYYGPGPTGGGMDLLAGSYNWAVDPDTGVWKSYVNRLVVGGETGEDGNGIEIDEMLIYNGVISDFSDGFVPEPATLALLGIGGVAVLLRRRG